VSAGNRIRCDRRWVEGIDGLIERFRYRLRLSGRVEVESSYEYQ
jgi:hypothetical protein